MYSSEYDELVVSVHDNGRVFTLCKPFKIVYEDKIDRVAVEVPDGFETDFATIPIALLPLMGYRFKYSKAAVVHDYLYSTEMYDRCVCDDLFYRAMLILGIPKWKAMIAYGMVRLVGWMYYGKK